MEKVKLLLQSIPRKAELNDSLSRMVDELEEAERLLGFDPAVDGHLDLRQG